ncbi:MAG: ankyrin repeat domain-containing protein [Phycisphaerales bacterium]|nr:ankyrin repeat domain-containing protein [Phycisphaerales bacterium]
MESEERDERDEYGATPLHRAAWAGDLSAIRSLLAAGANVNERVEDSHATGPSRLGFSALHFAAMNGHIDVITALLDAGADVNARDTEGGTPLHYAAGKGGSDVVSLLLKQGATPDAANEKGIAPLHYAAAAGSLDSSHTLLRAGADVNAQDGNGKTPLWYAARGGRGDVCYLLIHQWNAARTPDLPHAAAASGNTDTLLNCRGLDRTCDGDVDADGRSLLHEAAAHANAGMCDYLLSRSPFMNEQDPNAQDNRGRTPLHDLAALADHNEWRRKQSRRGTADTPQGIDTMDTYEVLCNHEADTRLRDNDGCLPLHAAARSGGVAATKALLTADSAPDSVGKKDKQGKTPLHLAAASGEAVVVNDLLSAGADVNAMDKEKQTPLHAAVAGEEVSIDVLKALLAAGADPKAKNGQGQTVEDVARANSNRLAKVLLKRALDQDNRGLGR